MNLLISGRRNARIKLVIKVFALRFFALQTDGRQPVATPIDGGTVGFQSRQRHRQHRAAHAKQTGTYAECITYYTLL